MTQVNLADYKNIYLQTAREYINNMSSSFAKLAGNLQDEDAINALHISSHSLRSQSQVMGFVNMANLCDVIEKTAKAALERRNKINKNLIAVFKEAVDALNLCLSQIGKENKEKDLGSIIKKLGDSSRSLS